MPRGKGWTRWQSGAPQCPAGLGRFWVERDQPVRLFDSFPDHRAAPVGRTARLCDLPRGTPALEDHGHQNQLGLTDTWVAQAPSHRRHQLRRVFVCLQRRYLCWPLASREPTPESVLSELFWLIRFASMTQDADRPPRSHAIVTTPTRRRFGALCGMRAFAVMICHMQRRLRGSSR